MPPHGPRNQSGVCGAASATVLPRRRPVHRGISRKFCASSANLFAFVSRPPRAGINGSTVLAVRPFGSAVRPFGSRVAHSCEMEPDTLEATVTDLHGDREPQNGIS